MKTIVMKIRFGLLFVIFLMSSLSSVFGGEMANPVTTSLCLDGKNQQLDGFLFHQNNYFKLRDIAELFQGTEKEFQVEWNPQKKAIMLYSSQAYISTREEAVSSQKDGAKMIQNSDASLYIDGEKKVFDTIMIGNHNYFKLRDIMDAFDVEVLWSGKKNMIYLNTNVDKISKSTISAQEVYDKCSPAVFMIETYDMDGDLFATGSGFLIHSNGTAVTNFHVLENAFQAKAVLTDGTKVAVKGVLEYNSQEDWAVIQLDSQKAYPFLSVGNSTQVKGGQKIFTIGNPMGLTNTISEGLVSNPKRLVGEQTFIQISAPISEGSSGGALLNETGEVIGVTTAGYIVGQNLNFAVPIHTIKQAVSGKTFISLQKMTENWTKQQYQNLPQAMDSIVEEEEPNDSLEEAKYISNGTTILGEINNNYLDNFYTMCNTKGTIELFCYSDSPQFQRLGILLEPLSYEGQEIAGDKLEFEDGSKVLYAQLPVEKPGYFHIMLGTEDTFYPQKDESIEYLFYYKFTPHNVK